MDEEEADEMIATADIDGIDWTMEYEDNKKALSRLELYWCTGRHLSG